MAHLCYRVWCGRDDNSYWNFRFSRKLFLSAYFYHFITRNLILSKLCSLQLSWSNILQCSYIFVMNILKLLIFMFIFFLRSFLKYSKVHFCFYKHWSMVINQQSKKEVISSLKHEIKLLKWKIQKVLEVVMKINNILKQSIFHFSL